MSPVSTIDRIITWSLRHPWPVVATSGVVAIAGFAAVLTLPIDAIPDLSENQVIVFADWPGHSPREVEDQVTFPLASRLQGMAELEAVRSSTEVGFAMVSLIFSEKADFHQARTRTLERLQYAGTGLPTGVVPYLAPEATALGQIYWYTLEGSGLDIGALRSIQDYQVRPLLAAVPGVAEVATVGGAVREIQVDLDPDRMRAAGVGVGQVLAVVAAVTGASGGQVVTHGPTEWVVRGLTAITRPEDVEAAVIEARPGAPVLVGSVARVHLGPAPRRSLLEKDGAEAVGGMVLMRHGENPLAVTERIRKRVAEIEPGLPAGLRIVPFYDRTRLIDAALGTLRRTLLEEVAVCMLMVLLVLRHLRSSLVIVLTLPVAVLAAFGLMKVFGVTSNIMSLAGIAIAIGVLADSAMVMTENAYTRLHERASAGPAEREATVRAACLTVGRPLFFSVLITIVSFLPVFSLSGQEGKLFLPLALTKTFALVAVAILAVTLVPALIPLLVRGRLRDERASWLVRSVADVYRPVLAFLLERPAWVTGSFALLVFVGVYLQPRLGSEFMPSLDEGVLLDMPVTAPGIPLPKARQNIIARDALLRTLPETEVVVGKVGRAETATDPAPTEMIETVIGLAPHDRWPRRALPPWVFTRVTRDALSDGSRVDEVALAAATRFDATMRRLFARGADLEGEADTAVWQAVRAAADERGLAVRPVAAIRRPYLTRRTKADLVRELDAMVAQPGWTNIWTQPIINRVDMLATGIRTQVGIKVLGGDLEVLQRTAEQVARVVRTVPGAADVFADQPVAQPYLEVRLDRARAAQAGVGAELVEEAVETALGGKVVGTAYDGRRRLPIRVRYAPDFRTDLARIGGVLVGDKPAAPLSRVADLRLTEGPSMIRGENGQLAAYVQLNVRGRDLGGFVEQARAKVAREVKREAGTTLAWGGQYEHELSARRTLSIIVPGVVALIFLILYLTWRDAADAAILLMAVPGAMVGGLVFQWVTGHPFSVAVWVGYIACFGLAASTGIIMLTYMREAIERRGGLAAIRSEGELKEVVLEGAVQRLRPKLLTEGVIVLSLLPMLWATGPGAEILRPMAAPVLGGVLVADEVVDLSIPALFYWLRLSRFKRARAQGREGLGAPAAQPVAASHP